MTAQKITSEQAKIATIEKWLEDNFLENTELLEKMILPKISEEDEQSLRSLQLDFENISEKKTPPSDIEPQAS